MCRACGSEVSGTIFCPFCGAFLPAKRAIRPLRLLLSGVSVLAVAALGLWVRAATRPAVPAAHREVAGTSVDAPRPQAREGPDAALPSTQGPALQTRWAVTWVNVRNRGGADAPVIAVLRPGRQVEVHEESGSWWLAYVDGKPLGYVASWLLRDAP